MTEEIKDLGASFKQTYDHLGHVLATRSVPDIGQALDSLPNSTHIPSVKKTGKITTLETKKNPIYLRLSDGTEAYFTYDEYNRIHGVPALGKTMTLVLQRHGKDNSLIPSKIDQAIIH